MAKKRQPEDSGQWYTNKDLYEIFNESMKSLSNEMKKTQEQLHKYNGLHDRFDYVEEQLHDVSEGLERQVRRCNDVQSRMAGKNDFTEKVIRIWPVLVTTVMAIFTIWLAMQV